MLLSLKINDKSFGNKLLLKDLELSIEPHEKIGLIGRNGVGKSTLIQIINQQDQDFDGQLIIKNQIIISQSRQEHHQYLDKTVLEYIVDDLPEYQKLFNQIQDLTKWAKTNQQLQQLTDAINRFSDLGYYFIKENLEKNFDNYQLDRQLITRPIKSLSGGQIRLIELIKIQISHSHLILLDEPTNHMDYLAKNTFIDWLKKTTAAVLIITHDRDVLSQVNRIVEIKNLTNYNYKGNYHDYLKNNAAKTISDVNRYDLMQKQIKTLQADVIRFKRLKEKSRQSNTIQRFKKLENKSKNQLEDLQLIDKPAFWIDQNSVNIFNDKITRTYDLYKSTNIKVSTNQNLSQENHQVILTVQDLIIGYHQKALFNKLNFQLLNGQRIRLFGRNGVGKSSLILAIMAQANHDQLTLDKLLISGQIIIQPNLKIGFYQQDISHHYLKLTLETAIEEILKAKNLTIGSQQIKKIMSDYLFNPVSDAQLPVNQLSGGQKARLQLIDMLANQPQLLILDEPTNHLDLPSVEELEKALIKFQGAIIYVTHDSFFAEKIKAQQIDLQAF